ncbi:MAG: UPF0182 family protein [Spirochaetia bacterium]|nr:UPF0182 family protein [Spirochaetia bacterium]
MEKNLQRIVWAIAALFIIILPLSSGFVGFLADTYWFEAVGYQDVFWKILNSKILIWLFFFFIFGILLSINYKIAWQFSGKKTLERVGNIMIPGEKFIHFLAIALIAVFSFLAASAALPKWQTVLEFLHGQKFNITDPIFNNDLSFYFFTLPFYESIKNWIFAFFILALIMGVIVYIITGALQWMHGGWKNLFTNASKAHISVLLAGLTFILAFGYWLEKFDLLYSSSGVVYGAGYTDAHARVFSYWFMSIASLAAAAIIIISLFRRELVLLLTAPVIILAGLALVHWIYPAFQQKFMVEPNELEKETPYIKHNINFTRMAYGLDKVKTQKYSGTAELTKQDLNDNKLTINNIRLWDWRPLLSTYRQIQEIRLYYKFNDVDIDRYNINGEYRQVMMAARELSYDQVPEQAKTWVNQRLKYTHGYGVVMSPVNEVTPEGMPKLFIKDIPPVSSININVTRPEIYFGEKTNHYIFTNTTTEEFDYPIGGSNKFTKYEGKAGVELSSLFKKLVYSFHYKTIKILISEYFTDKSKILYRRNIYDRVQTIAPFLRYDRDPYLTIVDGRLFWILDAYTYGNRYPYAEPIRGYDTNYIRNSVKVVIDAYNGTVDFYAIDENDPVLKTYQSIFPTLFKNKSKVPPGIKEHFRYPVDLFLIQSGIFSKYHMSDPGVFYNKEDLWRIPTEIYESKEQNVDPYYLIMKLPESQKEEFLLILPFTPSNKNNMVGWMTANSDGDNYGKLLLYEFPKQELIYGPMQIEARIDQDPAISELLTLWSQKGSNVIRGNLMVIPIADSLLYVEPLYLKADQAEMPALKRVIASYKNNIVMEETLQKALEAVFEGISLDTTYTKEEIQKVLSGDFKNLIQSAIDTYAESQKNLKEGNWTDYGNSQKQLEDILNKLKEQSDKK